MLKKVLLASAIILALVVVYTKVIPFLLKPATPIGDPQIEAAIIDFANKHVNPDKINIPRHAIEWKVEQLRFHKLTELPGPHNRKEIVASITGYYLTPRKDYQEPKRNSFKVKTKFNIGNKYPSGISVQHITR